MIGLYGANTKRFQIRVDEQLAKIVMPAKESGHLDGADVRPGSAAGRFRRQRRHPVLNVAQNQIAPRQGRGVSYANLPPPSAPPSRVRGDGGEKTGDNPSSFKTPPPLQQSAS